MRTTAELAAAAQELEDRIWYNRKIVLMNSIRHRATPMPPEDIMDAITAHMREIEQKYTSASYNTYEWGVVNGRLSALRWIFGEDWDMLDT